MVTHPVSKADSPSGPGAVKSRRRTRRLSVWDRLVVRRWQRIRVPGALNRLLITFVRVGDGWGWAVIAVVLFQYQPWPRFLLIVEQGLLAVAISLPVYWGLKLGFRRSRPNMGAKGFIPQVPPLDKYSFPSGHVMNNLAVAMTLAYHIPSLWPAAVVVPLSLGLLRVLYGVHFISDIAAGALLGAFSSWLAQGLFPRLFY